MTAVFGGVGNATALRAGERLWRGLLRKSGGRATALQKFSAVEDWARRRSFVAEDAPQDDGQKRRRD